MGLYQSLQPSSAVEDSQIIVCDHIHGTFAADHQVKHVVTAPRFQTSSIAAYLTALGSTYSGEFNKSGRGFPDVAAQGEGFEIVQDGENILVSGTSCSSPVFASVIGLINDRLIAAGKPALGFLNPWYSLPF
jgi:hypothetical protein